MENDASAPFNGRHLVLVVAVVAGLVAIYRENSPQGSPKRSFGSVVGLLLDSLVFPRHESLSTRLRGGEHLVVNVEQMALEAGIGVW